MSRRTVKRIIYGVGYLIVFCAVVFLIYSYAVKPAPSCFDGLKNGNETGIDCDGGCVPCSIKSLIPLQTSWAPKYFISGDKAIVAIEIKNPNLNHGADYFDYEISLLDAGGGVIKKTTGSSYVYAGEIKHIVEILPISVQETRGINKVSATFSSADWKPKEEFPKPEIQPRSLTAELKQIPPTISGLAANASAFPLSKATVFGFIYNNFGSSFASISSVSKTEIENIPAFGEKPFKLTFPRDLNPDSIGGDYKIYIEARQ